MDLTTLNVGDEVGIVRRNNLQGTYKVIKKDKMKVVLERDIHQRTFSVKTGLEKGSSLYYSADVVPLNVYRSIEDSLNKSRAISAAWNKLDNAVRTKNLAEAEEALANLKKVTA